MRKRGREGAKFFFEAVFSLISILDLMQGLRFKTCQSRVITMEWDIDDKIGYKYLQFCFSCLFCPVNGDSK